MRLVLALCVALAAATARAEPVTTILASGPSANRVDISFLGDGYTAAEQSKYATDVQTFMNQFLAEEPFSAYRGYFNVHRVDVVSQESGADKSPEGVFRNTALGAFYYCGNIERLICVDNGLVNGVLTRSLGATQRDLIVILVNDSKYGGSGGQWAVASTHVDSAEIARHEFGHSFGLLTDEYVDTSRPCNTSVEPFAANATIQTIRAQIKWTSWIAAGTPLPTTSTTMGVPGLYAGVDSCAAGMYRPTYDSKMRSLYRPFEQVNQEQLTKRIYNFVSPIDVLLPAAAEIEVEPTAAATFSVTPLQPDTHSLQIAWQVDGSAAGTGTQMVIGAGTLAPGTHTVTVTVSDSTTFVRSDPDAVLRDTFSWAVIVHGAGAPGAFGKVGPANGATDRLESLVLSWGVSATATSYRVLLRRDVDKSVSRLDRGRHRHQRGRQRSVAEHHLLLAGARPERVGVRDRRYVDVVVVHDAAAGRGVPRHRFRSGHQRMERAESLDVERRVDP